MKTTNRWLVSLTFRVTVSGIQSKDDSVTAGLEQLRQNLNRGENIPMEASVRRITNLVENAPIFGIKWRARRLVAGRQETIFYHCHLIRFHG